MVRHRRNHAITAVGLLLAAILMILGATQTLFVLQGPNINLGGALGVGLQPHGGYRLQDVELAVMFGAAAALVLCSFLLLVTRIRVLGLVWRLGALFCLLYPCLIVAWAWMFVSDPTAALKDEESSSGEVVLGLGLDALRSAGLTDVTPARGLYLLTAASVVAIVAVFVPAIRSEKVVQQPYPQAYPPPQP